MQRLVTFDCTSCGAPVHAPDTATALRCDYCGNNIMVPQHLRAAPPRQFSGNIVINTGTGPSTFQGEQQVVINRQGNSPRVVQGRGCVWGIVALVIVIVAASVLPAVIGIWAGIDAISSSIPRRVSFATSTPVPQFATKVLSFGGRGKGPGLFEGAIDVTSDASGDIYVLEGNSGRVQRFDRSGKYLNGWVIEDENHGLSSIVADRRSNAVYIVGKPKIYKYDGTTGNLISTPLEKGSGFSPTEDAGIFANGDLLTYVSGDSDDLVSLNPEGQEVGRFKSVFSTILGKKTVPPAPWNIRLTPDASGKMLVLNKPDVEVFIYGADGKYSTRFTSENDRAGMASDITVDSKGRIYVSHLHGIEVFDYTGRTLGQIGSSLSDRVEAVEITSRDELLALSGDGEITRYQLREPK